MRDGRVYKYDANRREEGIIDMSEQSWATGNFSPHLLRKAGNVLYLEGEAGGHSAIFSRTTDNTWNQRYDGVDRITHRVVTNDGMLALLDSGELLVLPNSGNTTSLLKGVGSLKWKRLEEDGFKNIWGLASSGGGDGTGGTLYCYQPSKGVWQKAADSINDICLVDQKYTGSVCVIVAGGSSGIQMWEVNAGEVKVKPSPENTVSLNSITSVSVNKTQVWGLTSNSTEMSLWRG